MDTQVIIPLVTLLLGFGLSFGAEVYRSSKERRNDLDDALRASRAQAYQAFLEAAQSVATHLGEATAGYPHLTATDEDRKNARLDVDRVFVPKLRNLEIVASDEALVHAKAMWGVLRTMRDDVVQNQQITYKSKEYDAIYGPYQGHRAGLIATARRDVVDG
jgi:hypothetical protein